MKKEETIDYEMGDEIVSKINPNKVIGKCTGFRHSDTCIDVDGKCYGGKHYFMKSEFTEFEIITINK